MNSFPSLFPLSSSFSWVSKAYTSRDWITREGFYSDCSRQSHMGLEDFYNIIKDYTLEM